MEPKLEKPGAGLPFIQGLVLRYWIMPRYSRKMSWDDASKYFEKECARISQLIGELKPEELARRELVDPIPGLEDSSRYWSIAMTLEHILIVTRGMSQIIETLGRGERFGIEVDVAKVKPLGQMPADQAVREFEELRAGFVRDIDSRTRDRDSREKHHLPWFGKINSRQWHWLVATHVGIHRKQIAGIAKKIRG